MSLKHYINSPLHSKFCGKRQIFQTVCINTGKTGATSKSVFKTFSPWGPINSNGDFKTDIGYFV